MALNFSALPEVDALRNETVMPGNWRARVRSDRPRAWWLAQASAYLTRLNPPTAALLAARRVQHALDGHAPLPLPRETVAIHVRRADAGMKDRRPQVGAGVLLPPACLRIIASITYHAAQASQGTS